METGTVEGLRKYFCAGVCISCGSFQWVYGSYKGSTRNDEGKRKLGLVVIPHMKAGVGDLRDED